MDIIHDQSALRDFYGTVHPLAVRKVLTRLDQHCRDFIARSPFLVLATADAAGGVDASPRGDAPGFVLVLAETSLLLPDRPGNNRVDSYGNVVDSPGVGLLFFVPGIEETLRVNGRAKIVTEPAMLEAAAAQGRAPKAGLMIMVDQAFFHCGKALKRAGLWDAGRHAVRSTFPTLGRIMADHTGHCAETEAEELVQKDYRTNLY